MEVPNGGPVVLLSPIKTSFRGLRPLEVLDAKADDDAGRMRHDENHTDHWRRRFHRVARGALLCFEVSQVQGESQVSSSN